MDDFAKSVIQLFKPYQMRRKASAFMPGIQGATNRRLNA